MFSAVIISTDPIRREVIQGACFESSQIMVSRVFDRFLFPYEFRQVMNRVGPDIIFLDLTNSDEALACAAEIGACHPKTILIGFGVHPRPREAGVFTELFPYVPEPVAFAAMIERAVCKIRGNVIENLFAFLPGKAGSGCSTAVMNTAGMMAATLKRKVLVVDGDLRSGVLALLLNCTPEYSTQDALVAAGDQDRFRLNDCIVREHDVDWLLASHLGKQPPQPPLWNQYFRLLELLQPRYDSILVDLPELINPASIETVRRAKRVFTVCTPELPSLKLARRRCAELIEWGIAPERISIILNRWHKLEIGRESIEKFLQHSVEFVFPNDYQKVRAATVAGNCVPAHTQLGKAYIEFARMLADVAAPEPSRWNLSFLKTWRSGRSVASETL